MVSLCVTKLSKAMRTRATNKIRKQKNNNSYELVCEVCGQPILLGDPIISKNSKVENRVYHPECYESLYIDV